MSNETENKNKTVLDLLEDSAKQFSDAIGECWKHSGESAAKIGSGLSHRFIVFHLASVKTFMHLTMNPRSAFSIVLGAVARELVNSMTEDEKAELAITTLEELDNAKRKL